MKKKNNYVNALLAYKQRRHRENRNRTFWYVCRSIFVFLAISLDFVILLTLKPFLTLTILMILTVCLLHSYAWLLTKRIETPVHTLNVCMLARKFCQTQFITCNTVHLATRVGNVVTS